MSTTFGRFFVSNPASNKMFKGCNKKPVLSPALEWPCKVQPFLNTNFTHSSIVCGFLDGSLKVLLVEELDVVCEHSYFSDAEINTNQILKKQNLR